MQELTGMLKALADETRLKIICLLLSHNFCVGALAHRLEISEAAVSQHLQILRKVGLVKGEKRGYWTHYSVQREMLNLAADKIRELALQPMQPNGNCHKNKLDSTECCKKGGKEDV